MSLFNHVKVWKFIHQAVRDYLDDMQSACDNVASCDRSIDKLWLISITSNGVKGQYDNILVVIYVS